MSQPELAEKLDVSKDYLNKILKCRAWPSYELARRIEELTGTPWAELISYER